MAFTTQYIGSRYVPKFAEPTEWNNTRTYEPLTIVTHNGNSYTSRQFVPRGIDILNDNFWAETGNYNTQVEQYRNEVLSYAAQATIYPTVYDMQKDTRIRKNTIVVTDHFHENDHGGCFYKIVETATANNMDTIALRNGLFAVFMGATNTYCVDCFGAQSDNDAIDNAPIINYMLATYGVAKLYGHYHILHSVTVKAGQELTCDGNYLETYGYVHKEAIASTQIYSFANLDGVLYTDDSFADTTMVSIHDGSVSKILVTNLSASPTNIYIPSFDGFTIQRENKKGIGSCHDITASGCRIGIFYSSVSGSTAYNLTGSACICGIKIIASDNRFVNLEANTNIHMAPTITPMKSNGGFDSILTGIMIYGGDNQFTNVRAEWCYYGINITCWGNHLTNVLIDWCDRGIEYIPNITNPSEDLWSCVAAFVRTYYVEAEGNFRELTKIFMTGCSFQTSDGSARFVESGDNVYPKGHALSIYPTDDSHMEFTITSSDLSYATLQNEKNSSDIFRYNPYIYATVVNCKLRQDYDNTEHMKFINNYVNSSRT